MTHFKAITGTAIEICEHLERLEGQIRRDASGLEMVEIFNVNNELLTLAWIPIEKKVRRQASLKKAMENGVGYGLDLIPCEIWRGTLRISKPTTTIELG
jgi:hypothetical protein